MGIHSFSRQRAVTVGHETHTIEEWCLLYKDRHITPEMVRERIMHGWTPQKAVTVPRTTVAKSRPIEQPESVFKDGDQSEWQFVHVGSRAGEYRRINES